VLIFSWASLRMWSSYLCLLCFWNYRHVPLCPACLLDGVPPTFCPSWTWTVVVLIATSCVIWIIGMSHWAWPQGAFDWASTLCLVYFQGVYTNDIINSWNILRVVIHFPLSHLRYHVPSIYYKLVTH
jgi:hypothetical protein